MSKKLTTVVTTCDSWQVTDECFKHVIKNSTHNLNRVVLLDNGSYTQCPENLCVWPDKIRFDVNFGSNAVFHKMLPFIDTDLVVFLHNDLPIVEPAWDKRVIEAFELDPLLGCVGFLGSDEVDSAGGRGLSTTSNFRGGKYETGEASPAEIHGKRFYGIKPAVTVDFCSMVFRKEVLQQLSLPEVPHHFYDRIWCLEILSKGWHVATLGVACDHFGGGIGMCRVPGEQVGVRNREDCYKRWLDSEGIPYDEGQDLNQVVYNIGEKIYLNKWRDELAFIPCKVRMDYTIEHRNWKYAGLE